MAAVALLLISPACNTVDDDRLPTMPVNISLSPDAMWISYGAPSYGDFRYFIKSERQPQGYPYTDRTATGFGGVLLINGVNPYTSEAGVPLAYDLSCPYERKPDIRVRMEGDGMLLEAVCPKCGSHYNVMEAGGSATSGPARDEKLGMTRYECVRSQYGGYVVIN